MNNFQVFQQVSGKSVDSHGWTLQQCYRVQRNIADVLFFNPFFFQFITERFSNTEQLTFIITHREKH